MMDWRVEKRREWGLPVVGSSSYDIYTLSVSDGC